jgi:hypothetical protein
MAQKKEKSNAPVEKNDIAKIEELGEELKKLRMELAQESSIKKEKKAAAKVEKKVVPKKEEKKVSAKVEKKVVPKKEEKKSS